MPKVVLILILMQGAVCQEATVTWLHRQEPVYPQMARIAHIQGSVMVTIEIQPGGAMVIQNAAGHPVLVQAAKDAIQHSTLRCDGCSQEPHTFLVVYRFKITDPPPPAPTPLPTKAPQRTRAIRCIYLWRCGPAWM